MLNTVFEKEVCSRCGGTGHYSYNQMDGSRCFGCGGKGERLTKRGAAASKFFTDSCMVPLGEIKVGDVMRVETLSADCRSRLSYFADVIEISEPKVLTKSLRNGEWVPNIGITVTTNSPRHGKGGLSASLTTLVRKGQSAEEKAAKIAAALAYQATLTKAGQPRKGK